MFFVQLRIARFGCWGQATFPSIDDPRLPRAASEGVDRTVRAGGQASAGDGAGQAG
jgi:hypothetical protein